MKTSRVILSYNGFGDAPSDVEARICAREGLSVVDRIGQDLVIEGPPAAVRSFVRDLRGWFSAPERRIRQPRVYAAG